MMSRIIPALAMFFSVLATVPAHADDLNAQLAHCMTINGAVERLSCYDRVARGAVNAAPQTQAGQSPAPQARIEPPADPARDFGKERLPSAMSPQSDRFTAEITDFQKDARDRFTVALQNGQVWQQVAGDTGIAQFRPGRTRQVTISRGALGSYDLRFNDRNASFKVLRVR